MNQPTAPNRQLLTPFNLIAGIILAGGAIIALLRFTKGLGVLGEASHTQSWGLFIGFNVMCGVALSAGGFVLGTAVHIFGMKEYEPVVRPAILTGFLGYGFVVVALLLDLGRPWRLPYPMTIAFGVTSVLFLVGWHVALYLGTQFVEISPAFFEWLGWKRWRKIAVSVTIGATVFGVVLSTLHQSALGGLLLIAPTKIHPLWYSPFIPLFYFVSAIGAGICMVIFESTISHRVFSHRSEISDEQLNNITIGLGKGACVTLMVYLAIKVVGMASADTWSYLGTPMGSYYMLELGGFFALPCFLFLIGFRERRVTLVRVAAVLTLIGVILNRLNTMLVAFNYKLPIEDRFAFHWMEVWLSISVITMGLVVFKWIMNRMPVLHEHPDYKGSH